MVPFGALGISSEISQVVFPETHVSFQNDVVLKRLSFDVWNASATEAETAPYGTPLNACERDVSQGGCTRSRRPLRMVFFYLSGGVGENVLPGDLQMLVMLDESIVERPLPQVCFVWRPSPAANSIWP